MQIIRDDCSPIIMQQQPLSMFLISAHPSLIHRVVIVTEVLPVIHRWVGHPSHLVSLFAVIELLDDLGAGRREASSHVYY